MKLFLRIIFLLAAAGAWVYSFLPKENAIPVSAALPASAPVSTPAASNSVVIDVFGGRAIREGKKAREVLKKVEDQRDADLSEID